jgi:hypothetical protein
LSILTAGLVGTAVLGDDAVAITAGIAVAIDIAVAASLPVFAASLAALESSLISEEPPPETIRLQN